MHKFRFNARQTKNLIVSMTLAVIIAMPMLAQPLGLSFADSTSQTDASEVQSSALIGEGTTPTTAGLEAMETFDSADLPLNRSMDENQILAMITAEEKTDEALAPGEEVDANYGEEFLTEDDQINLNATEPEDTVTELAAHTLYVKASSVNLRTEPSLTGSVLVKLSLGQKLICTGETETWVKVKDDYGHEGFISAEFTSKTMVFVDVSETVYVIESDVNLRSEPSTASTVLQKLPKDQKLTRTGIGDGWSRIKTASGQTAYVASDFLTKTVPASLRPAVTTKTTTRTPAATSTTVVNRSGNKVVDLAYSMLGVRYVFGSESRSGVDCSGLIYYIYRQIGVTGPRTSSGFANFGTAVSLSGMKPGDVIAMDTRTGDGRTTISHVGLYVGGGNMIHASSSHHKVMLVNLSQYLRYGIKIVTIRRIRT